MLTKIIFKVLNAWPYRPVEIISLSVRKSSMKIFFFLTCIP